jgi:DNA-binding NarL/FixJ family response regulator
VSKGESLAKCLPTGTRVVVDKSGIGAKMQIIDVSRIKVTPRDQQVIRFQGCSNKEIAAQLKISPRTVKNT